jgi:hypothetical protein
MRYPAPPSDTLVWSCSTTTAPDMARHEAQLRAEQVSAFSQPTRDTRAHLVLPPHRFDQPHSSVAAWAPDARTHTHAHLLLPPHLTDPIRFALWAAQIIKKRVDDCDAYLDVTRDRACAEYVLERLKQLQEGALPPGCAAYAGGGGEGGGRLAVVATGAGSP